MKMFHVERTASHRVLRWPSLLALALVPVLLAGLLLSTSWGRTERLASIDAAVVNNDAGTVINGQTIPLGRQLAAEIVSKPSTNVHWTLSDPADAAEGLANGRYSAVVTIPKDFSTSATSVAKAATAKQAVIDVQTSPASPVQDAEIARQVAQRATEATNAMLTGGYLDKIYVGFNTMGQQMVTMGNGAKQLSDGGSKLDDGISRATTGTAKLSQGLMELDANGAKLGSGASQLAGGASQLASGAAKLSSGVDAYTDGTAQVVGGIGQLSQGINRLDAGLQQAGSSGQFAQLGQLKDGAAQVATGAAGLSSGLGAYQKQLDAWSSGRQPMPAQVDKAYTTGITAECTKQITDALGQLGPQAQQRLNEEVTRAVDEAIDAVQANSPTPLTPKQIEIIRQQVAEALSNQRLAEILDDPTIAKQVSDEACPVVAEKAKPVFTAGFQAGTGTASAALDVKDARSGQSLKSGAAALATGAQQLSDGVARLVDELPRQMKAQLGQLTRAVHQLSVGANTLATRSSALVGGGKQLDAGAAQLASGAAKLSSGTGTFAAGVGQYTDGVQQASGGSQQLASGMTQLDAGAGKLAKGLDTFATKVGEGAGKIPSYSTSDRQKLSTVVAAPVVSADAITTPLRQLTALLLVLGAWLGSLLTWSVMRPVASRVLTSSRPSWQLAAATMVPGALVALAQGLLLAVLGAWALHLPTGRATGLAAFLVLTSLAFTAVLHALVSWFGSLGRALTLVGATVTAAVGTISTVPSLLHGIHAASPLAPALDGVRAVVSGTSMGAGPVASLLALWLAGAVFGLLAVVRRRRLTPERFAASSLAATRD